MSSPIPEITIPSFNFTLLYPGRYKLSIDNTDIKNISIPKEWNDKYEEGLYPFLPNCPYCDLQNVMCCEKGQVLHVICPSEHYKFECWSNRHFLKEPGVSYCPIVNDKPLIGDTNWNIVPRHFPTKKK